MHMYMKLDIHTHMDMNLDMHLDMNSSIVTNTSGTGGSRNELIQERTGMSCRGAQVVYRSLRVSTGHYGS